MKKKGNRECRVECGMVKLLLEMKLIFFLMFVSVVTLATETHGYSQQAKFNMNLEDTSVRQIFQQIEHNSDYVFIYSEKSVDINRKVNVSVRNEPVESILDQIFQGTKNYYEISDRQIAVLSKEKQDIVSSLLVSSTIELPQKDLWVSGHVTDEQKNPLPGVAIVLKGTNAGVITDADGNYRIKVNSPKASLMFSFVGMKLKEIQVDSREKIDLVMESIDQILQDVVIKGAYGTAQTRSDMVGSAYQVNSKQLENLPQTRVDLLLDGLVPGVRIDPNTDSPDNTRSRYNIRVRGDASLAASNEPLWILDGTPIFTGDRTNQVTGMSASISPLSFLNPNDIESITVLKDASATSIYGANGANGVILVTTKKGKKGESKFRFSTQFGISKINESTRFKVLNADQYMDLAKESYTNAGLDMKYFPFQDNDMNTYSTSSTDWHDVFYKIGNNVQGNLSMTGGTEKSAFYLSGSYFRESQTVKGNTTERYALRVNDDITLSDRLIASFNLSASYNINNLFNPGTDYYEYLPIFSPYNEDGTFRLYNKYVDGRTTNGDQNWKKAKFFNSVAEREENDNRQRTFMSNSNVMLGYHPMDGLDLTSQLGVDYQSSYEDIYDARTNWSGMESDGTPLGYATRSHVNHLTWTNIERVNYNRTIGKHSVSGVGGFEISSKEYHTIQATGSGFVNDHIKEVTYAVSRRGSSSANIDHAMSFFLQGSYSYDKRHYFTFNWRKDGNSNFGKDVRWANFGSLAYSWNIHNESFFHSDVVNVLKLKTSFGTNGNSRLGSQQAQGSYSYNDSDNYIDKPGGSLAASPNPDLSWETTYMANLGLRIELLDRLDIDAEYYHNKTVDLLSDMDVSRTTGDTRITRNVGSILNQGFEVNITSENIKNRNFYWTTRLNMAHNKNQLINLYNGLQKVMGNKIWREGEDINTYYLVRWAGVDPRDGSPLWYDYNGNITRTYSYDNRVSGKTSTPFLSGGITNTFEYKNFELRILCNYVLGGYSFSSFGRGSSSDGYHIMDENQSINQLDRWQKPGDKALSPKPIWGVSTGSVMNSTRYLYNKTNIRLQNIALTYQLPIQLAQSLGFNQCHLSFVADNVSVWTPYKSKNQNSYKQTMAGYPMESTFSLSLDLMF